MRLMFVASLILFSTTSILSAQTKCGVAQDVNGNNLAPQVTSNVKGPTLLRSHKTIAVPVQDRKTMKKWKSEKVVLAMKVDKNGEAHNIHVVNSNDPSLDGPAINAVQKWRWNPAEVDGQAIPANAKLSVYFTRSERGTS